MKSLEKLKQDKQYDMANIRDEKGNIKEEILKEMINEFIDRNPIIYERLSHL